MARGVEEHAAREVWVDAVRWFRVHAVRVVEEHAVREVGVHVMRSPEVHARIVIAVNVVSFE